MAKKKEALKWKGDNWDELKEFCPDCNPPDENGKVTIIGKEGNTYVNVGEVVVRADDGSFASNSQQETSAD